MIVQSRARRPLATPPVLSVVRLGGKAYIYRDGSLLKIERDIPVFPRLDDRAGTISRLVCYLGGVAGLAAIGYLSAVVMLAF